jgi:hypothetical protein
LSDQEVARAMQIRQPHATKKQCAFFCKPLTDLRKLEQLLDGEQRMLDGGTYFGLGLVLRILRVSHCVALFRS